MTPLAPIVAFPLLAGLMRAIGASWPASLLIGAAVASLCFLT